MPASTAFATRIVAGQVNYIGPMSARPRYYANDHSRDVLALDPRVIQIEDARDRAAPASLEREGFTLVAHKSAVADFRSPDEVARTHPAEIERLALALSGADRAIVTSAGILRFSESSPDSGRLNNSRPARFIHIDISDPTARAFAERSRPKDIDRPVRRFAHYNVWRVLSSPPQDVPLALCDARSLSPPDLMEADAVFDVPGKPEWSFEGLLIHYNPNHRWSYFSNMSRDEALVFKTNDSDPAHPHHVPHTAFNDPTCPPGVAPRASIEMRVICYWFDR
ncbi:MAG: hypothetical protein JWN85_3205 [Gammaproteobacteria bacterium]|nr:hypothetical protein [Gammaproteobacteria bacterium]